MERILADRRLSPPRCCFGPAAGTPAWEIVHATGQKIIVAASILTGLIQALIVQPLPLKNAELPSNS